MTKARGPAETLLNEPRCMNCRRKLSDPVSIERGCGPSCWASIQALSKRPCDPANRSDYEYHYTRLEGRAVLVITDLDRGGMSVTDNMEAILDRIAYYAGADPYFIACCGPPVICRDPEGNYDGVRLSPDGTVTFTR